MSTISVGSADQAQKPQSGCHSSSTCRVPSCHHRAADEDLQETGTASSFGTGPSKAHEVAASTGKGLPLGDDKNGQHHE